MENKRRHKYFTRESCVGDKDDNNIVDKDGKSIETSKVTSKPSDRHFRNAWTLSGTVISEDLATAKTMFKDKIREVRKPLLKTRRIVHERMEDGSSSTEQKTIAK